MQNSGLLYVFFIVTEATNFLQNIIDALVIIHEDG
jgi:hypothetical protein